MGHLNSTGGKALFAEFISETVATFFFTVVAGLTFGSPLSATSQIAGVAVGLAAALLSLSEKAHLNAVVSIAVALSDPLFGWVNLIIRWLAQILGAILGGLVSVHALRDTHLQFTFLLTPGRVLIFEILFSALLVLVVLRTRKSVLFSFAHGLTYLVAIFTGGAIYGSTANALLNPLVSIGLMIGSIANNDNATDKGNLWLYIVGPVIGALLGVILFQLNACLDLDDDDESSYDDDTTEQPMKQVVYETKEIPARPSDGGYGQQGGGYRQPMEVTQGPPQNYGRGQAY